jgi:hypothetical protein
MRGAFYCYGAAPAIARAAAIYHSVLKELTMTAIEDELLQRVICCRCSAYVPEAYRRVAHSAMSCAGCLRARGPATVARVFIFAAIDLVVPQSVNELVVLLARAAYAKWKRGDLLPLDPEPRLTP